MGPIRLPTPRLHSTGSFYSRRAHSNRFKFHLGTYAPTGSTFIGTWTVPGGGRRCTGYANMHAR